MSIKVCHFSDWHGHFRTLPEADLYVCTGDMLRNFPVKDRDKGSYTYREMRIDPLHEEVRQEEFAYDFVSKGGFKRLLGTPQAPVVCLRGNHDFIDLKSLFVGCDVTEFLNNELKTIHLDGYDLLVTGHRGIPFIYGGWSDETQRPELLDRARAMPAADLFLTHYAPAGILDSNMPPGLSMGGGWAESWGLEGLGNIIIDKGSDTFVLTDDGLNDQTALRAAHCFGHIHECGGCTMRITDVIFSNAACSINVFEIDPVR